MNPISKSDNAPGHHFHIQATEEKIRKVLSLIRDAGWKPKTALSLYGLDYQDIKDRL